MSQETNVEQIREFWESHPLWSGESAYEPGSREFFEEHRQVVLEDCFASSPPYEWLVPAHLNQDDLVLDLGCGPGMWSVELQLSHEGEAFRMFACDLTKQALELTKKRLEQYGLQAELSQQNAESLTYEKEVFSHVNCLGVIHHTPDTTACIQEIARVLKPGGTANIAVYYKNFFVNSWPRIAWIGRVLHRMGGGLKGRGRESIFLEPNPDEVVRLYDGAENPIGKAYTKEEFASMCEPYFTLKHSFLYFFPKRSLPIPLPKFLHRFLDHRMGFMINFHLEKK